MSYGISGLGSYNPAPVTNGSSTSSSNQTNPFANLNLTSQQYASIESILQNAKSGTLTPSQVQSQFLSVLTPQQQQTLQGNLQQAQGSRGHGHGHGHHHHGGSGSSSSAISGVSSDTDAFGVPAASSTSNGSTPQSQQNPFSSIAAQYSLTQQLSPTAGIS